MILLVAFISPGVTNRRAATLGRRGAVAPYDRVS
jgi:hypothetical protein